MTNQPKPRKVVLSVGDVFSMADALSDDRHKQNRSAHHEHIQINSHTQRLAREIWRREFGGNGPKGELSIVLAANGAMWIEESAR